MGKILFLCFVLLPFTAFADVTAGEYTINVSVTQRGYSVEVGGRIKSGPRCENLLISSTAVSDQGHVVTIFAPTSYSGSGSSLYDAKKDLHLNNSRGFPSWKVVQTLATCND